MLTEHRRCMSFGSSSVLAMTLMLYQVMSHAQAASAICKNPNVKFDGLAPLTYAVVNGDGREKSKLYSNHPSGCTSSNDTHCKIVTELRPNDVVAIGGTCGKWDYVQHLSDHGVVVGWIDDSQLSEKSSPTRGREGIESDKDSAFKLIRGKGVPVCEAYLQRINDSTYSRSPYCGFPEDTRVPGFDRLDRAWLSWDDIRSIKNNVNEFVASGIISSRPNKTSINSRHRPAAYRFTNVIDVDNDGQPDKILMWSFENRDAPTCGQYFGANPEIDKHGAIGIILTSDGKQIDVEQTKRIFGSKLGGIYMLTGDPPRRVFQARYTPIGFGYNIFKYRGLYYYSTYLDGFYDFDDALSRAQKDEDTLGVFIRKDGSTTKVCEFHSPVAH